MKSRESAERLVIFGTVMLVSAWALLAGEGAGRESASWSLFERSRSLSHLCAPVCPRRRALCQLVSKGSANNIEGSKCLQKAVTSLFTRVSSVDAQASHASSRTLSPVDPDATDEQLLLDGVGAWLAEEGLRESEADGAGLGTWTHDGVAGDGRVRVIVKAMSAMVDKTLEFRHQVPPCDGRLRRHSRVPATTQNSNDRRVGGNPP